MQLGIAIWIILVIALLGGFSALAFMGGLLAVAFIAGLVLAARKTKKI